MASNNQILVNLILKDEMSAKMKAARAAVDAMTDAEKQAAVAAHQHAQAMNETEKSAASFTQKLGQFKLAMDGAQQLAQAFTGTFQKAFELGKEGAQLDLTKQRFDRLAGSINTTSDALMTKLSTAMAGMSSNAEMMQSATEIISLGLANDEEGVVRLATLIGKLGWDMQTVIMTFANDSKMRLDQLGLSVSDVDARMEKFKKQGIEASKAFDLAVIEAGEEKLKLLGDQADTSVGAFARLDASFKNVTDEVKLKLAPALADAAQALDLILTWDKKIEAAEKQHSDQVAKTAESYEDYIAEMQRAYSAAGKQLDATGKLVETFDGLDGSFYEVEGAQVAMTRAQFEAARSAAALAKGTQANIPTFQEYTSAVGLTAEQLKRLAAEEEKAAAAQRATIASIVPMAISMTEAQNKRAEVEKKLADIEKEIAKNGPVRVATVKNEKLSTEELAAAQAKLAAQQAKLVAANNDLAGAQRKKGETDAEYNARMADTRAKAAELQVGISELNGKLGEHTAVVGGATEQQLKERDALQATLAEMQRTAEIEAAKSAFQALAKSFEAGRLSEDEYLAITKRLNDETQLYTDKAYKAATSAVMLNEALGNSAGADQAWAAIMKYGDGLGRAVGLQQQLAAGQGAPATPTTARKAGGEVDMASGGDFIVPPGYPNDTFRVNASSGERVIVRQAGATTNNNTRQGDTFNVSINDGKAAAMFIDWQRRQKLASTAANM